MTGQARAQFVCGAKVINQVPEGSYTCGHTEWESTCGEIVYVDLQWNDSKDTELVEIPDGWHVQVAGCKTDETIVRCPKHTQLCKSRNVRSGWWMDAP